MSTDFLIFFKVFLIWIIFGKNDFVLFSRCPISIFAKVEKLALLFSNLLGHTFALNVLQTLNNESGPETIAGERPKPNVVLIFGLD